MATSAEAVHAEEGKAGQSVTHASAEASARGSSNWANLAAYVFNFAVTYVSITGAFGETNTDLSKKYQTLVTPAGWAFSIWGLIFTWEGVWAVAQMLPRFSQTEAVRVASPWWWTACLLQAGWTLAFAQESIPLSLCFMLGILVSLLGAVLALDRTCRDQSALEYLLLRAPFALHLGWIIAASNVNANVVADWDRASPGVLLGCAASSIAAVASIASVFSFGLQTPEPIVGLVAAWALLAIGSELQDPVDLKSPLRWNPHTWDTVTLEGLRCAALVASTATFLLAVYCIAVRAWRGCQK